MGIAVAFRNVTKTYPLYRRRRQQILDHLGWYHFRRRRGDLPYQEFFALQDIDVEVERGSRVAIVGRNGAGKTTLLKLITGNFPPTRGEVIVQGAVQALLRTGLGFHPEFTGRDNIHAALTYQGLSRQQVRDRAEEIIAFAELGLFINQPFKSYSLGMQARLQFATATAISPDILIVDEVLGAGDGYFSNKCFLRMKKLMESGCTLLMVSHLPWHLLQFCDKAIWLQQGRVLAQGTASDILKQYEFDIAGATAAAPAVSGSDGWRPMDLTPAPHLLTRHLVQTLDRRDPPPANPAVEIESVAACHRGECGYLTAGSPLRLSFQVVPRSERCLARRYELRLYTTCGDLVAQIVSPIDAAPLAAGTRKPVEMHCNPICAGAGQYFAILRVLSADRKDPMVIGRYPGYLSLCIPTANESDPPLLHHPGTWHCGSDAPAPALIRAFN
jgi:ABC-type polysaccharide/polyol phosphate transport system ATPase subunit